MTYLTSKTIRRSALSLVLFCSLGLSGAHAGQSLLESAKKQDWEAVTAQLKQKPDINMAQADGTTALIWAVHWNKLDMVKALIAAKANVNSANDLGITPLMLATKNRNLDMVTTLLEAGADPDKGMWTGENPLMTAARTGQADIVRELLDQGANVNASEPRRGQTALMWAISFRSPDVARILVEAGANVNSESHRLKEEQRFSPMVLEGYAGNVSSVPQGGYTPLMFAARVDDLQSARLLINKGAKVNTVSADDGSALVIASAWGHEDLALYLLEQGATPNTADANGMTALHYTMRDGLKLLHGYEIVATTRVCGFAGDSLCKPLETLTDEEKEMMNDEAVGLYIVEGEIDSNNTDEGDPVDVILPGGNMYELAEALLARGADVNAKMKYPPPRLRLDSLPWLNLTGATPIMLASASLDTSAMEMLLEHGANPLVKTEVNKGTFKKQTKTYADDNQILGNGSPLMVATGMGKKNDFTPQEEKQAITTAERLIELGADVNEATATGWTPLHAAAFIGGNSVIKFLVDQGADINARNGCGRTPLSLASGESVVGLLDRTLPRKTTMDLLVKLGANDAKAGKPVGDCILGRGGLEVDIEINKEIEAIRAQQRQQQQQQNQ